MRGRSHQTPQQIQVLGHGPLVLAGRAVADRQVLHGEGGGRVALCRLVRRGRSVTRCACQEDRQTAPGHCGPVGARRLHDLKASKRQRQVTRLRAVCCGRTWRPLIEDSNCWSTRRPHPQGVLYRVTSVTGHAWLGTEEFAFPRANRDRLTSSRSNGTGLTR